ASWQTPRRRLLERRRGLWGPLRRRESATERRGPLCPKGIPNTQGSGSLLCYPISATAAERPLPRKGPESFPSWTSPVRRRSPALDETLGNTEGFFRVGGSEPSLLTEGVPGGFRGALERGEHLVEALSVHAPAAVVLPG